MERDTAELGGGDQKRLGKPGCRPGVGLPSGWELSTTPGSCFSLPFLKPSNVTVSRILVSGPSVKLISIPGPVLSDLWSPSLSLHLPPPQSHLLQMKQSLSLLQLGHWKVSQPLPLLGLLCSLHVQLLKPPIIKVMKPSAGRATL